MDGEATREQGQAAAVGAGSTIAVLGSGAMGEALVRGILRAALAEPSEVMASDLAPARREALEQACGIRTTPSNLEAARFGRTVILAVKPQNVHQVLAEVAPAFDPQRLLISIAAGVPTATLERHLAPGVPVIRVMPNNPCLVGEGMTAVCRGSWAGREHEARALQIFNALGRTVVLPEALLDAVTGLSGSGPAYAYLVIEALADGGVAAGLSRETAITMAAQTLLGSAAMVLRTGRHPAALKDAVASPAGTTIEGLRILEQRGVRGAFLEAVLQGARRSAQLGESR